LVSIIIPAYNSGKYMNKMLDSIYASKHSNIELIIAYDNRSTDNTLEILCTYSNTYNNIIIAEGIDNGPGQARNRVLPLAKGNYVIFLDADDIITPSHISGLLEVFDKYPELNVVCGSHIRAEESEINNKYSRAIKSKKCIKIYSKEEVLQRLMVRSKFVGGPWVWMVKRAYIADNNIAFPNYSYGEDNVYTYQLVLNADKIGHTTNIGYIYIQHTSSLANSIKSPEGYWDAFEKCRNDTKNLLQKNYIHLIPYYQSVSNMYMSFISTIYRYDEFSDLLNKCGITKLLIPRYSGIYVKCGILCFNISRYLFWKILQIKSLKKIVYNMGFGVSNEQRSK